MNEKFTPGPWSVFNRLGTIQVDIGEQAKGKRPCIVEWSGFDQNDLPEHKNRANARLIAAAPDMYEALEQAAEWLKGWASADPQLAVIEKALAKARGGL